MKIGWMDPVAASLLAFSIQKKYEKNVNASETTTICALKMTGNYGCGRLIQIILLSKIWLE